MTLVLSVLLGLILQSGTVMPAPLPPAPAVNVSLAVGDRLAALVGVEPIPRSHTVRIAILSFSSDAWTMDGGRAALRTNGTAPRFQVMLPAGANTEDVVLLRFNAKDGRRSVHHSGSEDHPFQQ